MAPLAASRKQLRLTTGTLTLALALGSLAPVPVSTAPAAAGWALELTAWTLQAGSGAGGARGGTVWNVTAPCTVMACLTAAGEYPDLFYGDNLAKVDASVFDVPWWYTTTFDGAVLPPDAATLTLAFHGINYRANLWLNGAPLATNATFVGTFTYFEFDITPGVARSGPNSVTLQVWRPHDRALPSTNHDTDLAISFVDWSPSPPDSSMGLWRSTWLYAAAGPLTVQYPLVDTVVAAPGGGGSASVTVGATVTAPGAAGGTGNVTATLVDPASVVVAVVSQVVTVPAGAAVTVTFTPAAFPALTLAAPALWWPWQMGTPALYTLNVSVAVGGVVSDTVSAAVGLRQVTSSLTDAGHRLYAINGLPLLIRGGGWAPDLLLREDAASWATALAYTRDMGLNTIRLEGKMEPDGFFAAADAAGLLVMVGWCCCDAWQHWPWWGAQQYAIANASMSSQVVRLRAHPSVLVFLLSSDEMPPKDVEAEYLAAAADGAWPNPTLSAAAAGTSPLTNSTGVKMSGPYSWVPPNYWLTDPGGWGGGWGFLTEGGPGENPLSPETLAAYVPAADLWPPAPDSCWGHCGNPLGLFGAITRFNTPLAARYGASASLAAYSARAAASVYEGHRAMFEGYSRNKYGATGVIQWMLNSPWPSSIWHLFEYTGTPGAAYFATKKACEPLHPLYGYDDAAVYVVNSAYAAVPGGTVTVTATLRAVNGTTLFTTNATLPALAADGVARLFSVPSPATVATWLGDRATYLLRLTLAGGANTVNDYWLSTRADVLNWNASTFYNTPVTQYGDLTALTALPPVNLTTTAVSPSATTTTVTLTNPSTAIAFQVRVRLVAAGGAADVLPLLWNDNYIMLLPGETRNLTATYAPQPAPPTAVVTSWNDAVAAAP